MPKGLDRVFRCTRAVSFQSKDSPIPSFLGTGFFINLFNETFFVTARHVIDNQYNFHYEDIKIPYDPTGNECVVFEEIRRHITTDPDDTDHVDVVVLRAARSRLKTHLFRNHPPYEISGRPYVYKYDKEMILSYLGFSPNPDNYDYENERYRLDFSSGDLRYRGQEPKLRSIHTGATLANDYHPDFDGLSGSPLFLIDNPNDPRTSAQFAGMLLRGTRSSGIFYFIDAAAVMRYLLDYFLAGLSEEIGKKKLESLMMRYGPGSDFSLDSSLYNYPFFYTAKNIDNIFFKYFISNESRQSNF